MFSERAANGAGLALILLAACAAVSVAIARPAQALIILDQQQNTISTTQIIPLTQVDLAQSFQTPNSNVAGAGVRMHPGLFISGQVLFQGSGSVEISLWDALPNAGGNQLATGSAAGSSNDWLDVFWTPVAVTPNTDLFLVFVGTVTSGQPAYGFNDGNPYPSGIVYATAGFLPQADLDMTFRTWSDVPEPNVFGLLGLGLAGLAVARRGHGWSSDH